VTKFYPDCSNNNWANTQDALNFCAQLVPQGFDGMCHKMSEGNYYEDPYGPGVQQWCAQNGVTFIGYHYVTGDDPAEQAQTWLAAGGGTVAMMDWEANGGDVTNLYAVMAAFAAVGVTPHVGYAPQWYWSGVGQGNLSAIPTLVSSAYPGGSGSASEIYENAGGDSGQGWASYADATPTIWQFTNNADIPPHSGIDCNAYRGDDLAVAFGLTTTQEGSFLSGLTQAQQEDIYNLVVLSAQQLLGLPSAPLALLPGSPTPVGDGWSQLGQDGAGQNLTLVDALSVAEPSDTNSIGVAVQQILQLLSATKGVSRHG